MLITDGIATGVRTNASTFTAPTVILADGFCNPFSLLVSSGISPRSVLAARDAPRPLGNKRTRRCKRHDELVISVYGMAPEESPKFEAKPRIGEYVQERSERTHLNGRRVSEASISHCSLSTRACVAYASPTLARTSLLLALALFPCLQSSFTHLLELAFSSPPINPCSRSLRSQVQPTSGVSFTLWGGGVCVAEAGVWHIRCVV